MTVVPCAGDEVAVDTGPACVSYRSPSGRWGLVRSTSGNFPGLHGGHTNTTVPPDSYVFSPGVPSEVLRRVRHAECRLRPPLTEVILQCRGNGAVPAQFCRHIW